MAKTRKQVQGQEKTASQGGQRQQREASTKRNSKDKAALSKSPQRRAGSKTNQTNRSKDASSQPQQRKSDRPKVQICEDNKSEEKGDDKEESLVESQPISDGENEADSSHTSLVPEKTKEKSKQITMSSLDHPGYNPVRSPTPTKVLGNQEYQELMKQLTTQFNSEDGEIVDWTNVAGSKLRRPKDYDRDRATFFPTTMEGFKVGHDKAVQEFRAKKKFGTDELCKLLQQAVPFDIRAVRGMARLDNRPLKKQAETFEILYHPGINEQSPYLQDQEQPLKPFWTLLFQVDFLLKDGFGARVPMLDKSLLVNQESRLTSELTGALAQMIKSGELKSLKKHCTTGKYYSYEAYANDGRVERPWNVCKASGNARIECFLKLALKTSIQVPSTFSNQTEGGMDEMLNEAEKALKKLQAPSELDRNEDGDNDCNESDGQGHQSFKDMDVPEDTVQERDTKVRLASGRLYFFISQLRALNSYHPGDPKSVAEWTLKTASLTQVYKTLCQKSSLNPTPTTTPFHLAITYTLELIQGLGAFQEIVLPLVHFINPEILRCVIWSRHLEFLQWSAHQARKLRSKVGQILKTCVDQSLLRVVQAFADLLHALMNHQLFPQIYSLVAHGHQVAAIKVPRRSSNSGTKAPVVVPLDFTYFEKFGELSNLSDIFKSNCQPQKDSIHQSSVGLLQRLNSSKDTASIQKILEDYESTRVHTKEGSISKSPSSAKPDAGNLLSRSQVCDKRLIEHPQIQQAILQPMKRFLINGDTYLLGSSFYSEYSNLNDQSVEQIVSAGSKLSQIFKFLCRDSKNNQALASFDHFAKGSLTFLLEYWKSNLTPQGPTEQLQSVIQPAQLEIQTGQLEINTAQSGIQGAPAQINTGPGATNEDHTMTDMSDETKRQQNEAMKLDHHIFLEQNKSQQASVIPEDQDGEGKEECDKSIGDLEMHDKTVRKVGLQTPKLGPGGEATIGGTTNSGTKTEEDRTQNPAQGAVDVTPFVTEIPVPARKSVSGGSPESKQLSPTQVNGPNSETNTIQDDHSDQAKAATIRPPHQKEQQVQKPADICDCTWGCNEPSNLPPDNTVPPATSPPPVDHDKQAALPSSAPPVDHDKQGALPSSTPPATILSSPVNNSDRKSRLSSPKIQTDSQKIQTDSQKIQTDSQKIQTDSQQIQAEQSGNPDRSNLNNEKLGYVEAELVDCRTQQQDCQQQEETATEKIIIDENSMILDKSNNGNKESSSDTEDENGEKIYQPQLPSQSNRDNQVDPVDLELLKEKYIKLKDHSVKTQEAIIMNQNAKEAKRQQTERVLKGRFTADVKTALNKVTKKSVVLKNSSSPKPLLHVIWEALREGGVYEEFKDYVSEAFNNKKLIGDLVSQGIISSESEKQLKAYGKQVATKKENQSQPPDGLISVLAHIKKVQVIVIETRDVGTVATLIKRSGKNDKKTIILVKIMTQWSFARNKGKQKVDGELLLREHIQRNLELINAYMSSNCHNEGGEPDFQRIDNASEVPQDNQTMYDRSEFKGFAQGEIKGFAQGELKGFKPDFQTDNRDVQSEKHTPQSRDEIRVDTQSMLTKQGSGRWSIRYLAVKDYNEVLALQEKFYGLDPTVDEVLHGLLQADFEDPTSYRKAGEDALLNQRNQIDWASLLYSRQDEYEALAKQRQWKIVTDNTSIKQEIAHQIAKLIELPQKTVLKFLSTNRIKDVVRQKAQVKFPKKRNHQEFTAQPPLLSHDSPNADPPQLEAADQIPLQQNPRSSKSPQKSNRQTSKKIKNQS